MAKEPKEKPPYLPIEDWLRENKGRKLILSCGHKATIGHNFSNTIIIHAGTDFHAVCHECGY